MNLIYFMLLIASVLGSWEQMGVDIDEPFIAEFDFMGDGQLPELDKRKSSSEGLQEFTPIRATIGQSETQTYSFNVNTSSGLGEYYEFLIFITGNICSEPDNLSDNSTNLALYYSFNYTMLSNLEVGKKIVFDDGYLQALEDVPITKNSESQDSVLYIAVVAPENTDSSSVWLYEIGVSQNDLVFQWDDRSWASLVDSDYESALIVTGNLSDSGNQNYSNFNVSHSRYSLFIYSQDYKHYFDRLNSSWCAVRNGPALMSTTMFESSFTERGGGLQQQFYVSGLNSSTKYIAYLVSDFGGRDFGGAVYRPFEFDTMNSEGCSLIFDMDFCNQVAYSVPNNLDYTKEELKDLYDNRARDLYKNFSKALDQIPCDASQDAIFSPFRSCDDCAESYRNWLCAVTIPRCSTRNRTGYIHRDQEESRNDWINTKIQPLEDYYEILPCLNVCQAIVRDCPAGLGFACPSHNKTVSLSYYWEDSDEEYPTCNYVGKTNYQTNAAAKLLASISAVIFTLTLHLL